MFKKKITLLALSAIFSLPVYASVGEVEDDDYGTEHQELDDDLHTSLGMTVTTHADGHKEVEDGNGNHYSYSLQVNGATNNGCPSGQTVCYRDFGDGSGTIEVNYNTGRSELAHPESHNEIELDEHAAQLGFSIVSKTNGVMTVHHAASGSEYSVRNSPQMVRGAAGLNPGIRIEDNGRIVERYTDGWEQEILLVR